ncbi:flagellar hook-associated protein FlgL [Proteiniclasticum ruminis]|uniref:Flagellar hook-associated protein 3 FlgL n=1 Tax=Proteiniclasticum ruminis TaxID=398199 RepID=A0A1G8I0W3_9CLOT|nr:flagellar hook-associated protein FlgL [Proteiniclasticum ruminis]SDI12625.1 flagellar hook-associated protein 3 FlgL [Proteiniclasticum ruminis]
MRITNNTLTGNYLRNLNRNLKAMQKYQNQLSSGKEVSRPSDNPMLVARIMQLDSNVRMNEQYEKNIGDALGWTDTADGALNVVTSTLQRARELIIYGANGTLSDTDRSALKDEVDTLQGQLMQVLNTNYDGRYIFGGQKTTEPPFQIDEVSGKLTYSGDNSNIEREISKGVNIAIPTDGSGITVTEGTSLGNEDIGSLFRSISEALDSGNTEDLSGKLLGDIDKHLDNTIRFRSKMGAVYNRLESAKERNAAENLSMTELLSKSEDIDLAEKMMEFSTMRTVYQASLQTGAQILQPSLLDYIR